MPCCDKIDSNALSFALACRSWLLAWLGRVDGFRQRDIIEYQPAADLAHSALIGAVRSAALGLPLLPLPNLLAVLIGMMLVAIATFCALIGTAALGQCLTASGGSHASPGSHLRTAP
jgi:hypothetical protein